MNIFETLQFNPSKPSILLVRKSETIKIFCVGLLKDQILTKHQAKVPSLLVVLKGEIQFSIGGDDILMSESQTFQIPVNTEHEVKGCTNENIFLITQELI